MRIQSFYLFIFKARPFHNDACKTLTSENCSQARNTSKPEDEFVSKHNFGVDMLIDDTK